MTLPPNETTPDERAPKTDYPSSEYGEATPPNALAPPTDLNTETAVPDELGGDGDNPVDKDVSADQVDLSGGAENAAGSAGNAWNG